MRDHIFWTLLLVLIILRVSNGAKSVKKDLLAQNMQPASDYDFNDVPATSDNLDYNNPKPVNTKKCIPGICPRMYKPICISVDGIPLTSPTMCHYRDKIRCYKEILAPGERMPVFRVLHQGECNGSEKNILKLRPEAISRLREKRSFNK